MLMVCMTFDCVSCLVQFQTLQRGVTVTVPFACSVPVGHRVNTWTSVLYTHTHTHMRTYVHAHTHTSHTYMHTHTHTHTHTCARTCTRACTHTSVRAHARTHTHTLTHIHQIEEWLTHVLTCIHKCTHTHTHHLDNYESEIVGSTDLSFTLWHAGIIDSKHCFSPLPAVCARVCVCFLVCVWLWSHPSCQVAVCFHTVCYSAAVDKVNAQTVPVLFPVVSSLCLRLLSGHRLPRVVFALCVRC